MTESKSRDGKIKRFQQDAKTQAKLPRKITGDYLHNSGLYYLQRFAASSAQFRRVMARKVERSCQAHPEQDREQCLKLIDALVEKFQRSGLLDDDLYLRGSVLSLRRRGLSARAIEAKLAAKGLTADQIRPALARQDEETGSTEPDLQAALRLARRRRAGPFSREVQNDQSKAMAALARAGFDYQTARKALSMSLEDAEAMLLHLS
jgi:regulatory protein